MKSCVFAILIILIICVGYSQAHWCRRPTPQMCSGRMNMGQPGPGCRPRTMWWYNSWSRRCQPMLYRGCGGNWNRFCSATECERRCSRRTWPQQG